MTIDQRRCLAPRRKGSDEQCPHPRIFGDFCGKHRTSAVRVGQSNAHSIVNTNPVVNTHPQQVIDLSLKRLPLLHIRLKSRIVTETELWNGEEIPLTRYIETLDHYGLSTIGAPAELKAILMDFYCTITRCQENISKMISLQRAFRRKQIRQLCGETWDRGACNNIDELETLGPLSQVPMLLFFSFRDPNGLIYGFNIYSLRDIIDYSNKSFLHPKNPYTNTPMSGETIAQIEKKLQFLESLGLQHEREAPPERSRQDFRALDIFQRMELFGYPVNYLWFLSLDFRQLKEFYLGLEDIWRYRLNLRPSQKQRIVRNPDVLLSRKVEVREFTEAQYDELQDMLLTDMEKMVSEGITRDDCVNGVLYILTGLVQVSPEAANALPTLTYAVGLSD